MISSTTNRVAYLGDGTSALFAFQYEFHADSDLDIYIWNSARIIATSPQVITTNYTISGTKDAQNRYTNGANVIFNSTPSVGDHVVIVRDVAASQPFNLKFNQVIPNADLIKALDRLAIVEQRLAEYTTRGVRLADSYPLTINPTLPDRLPKNAPLIVGSGGITIEVGVVAFDGSTAATYFGILPVPNGGTGLDFSLLDGIIYSPGNNTTFERIIDGGQDVPLIGTAGSSAPTFAALNLAADSSVVNILAQRHGGTGTASSFQQFSVFYQSDTNVVGAALPAAEGFAFVSHASSAPTFEALSASIINSGILITAHGGTGTELPYNAQGVVYMSSATRMASTSPGGDDQPLVGNIGTAPSYRALPLASNSSVSGILAQAHGGTGTASSFQQFSMIYQKDTLNYGHIPPSLAGTVLTQNASSAPTFEAVTVTPVAPTTLTAASTLTNSISKVILNSSNYDVKLYDLTGQSGREIEFLRIDGTFANPINIVCSAAQFIVGIGNNVGTGSSFQLYTQNESLKLFNDGTNWRVENHFTSTPWAAFPSVAAGTLITAVTTSPAYGVSVVTNAAYWRRIGKSAEIRWDYRQVSAGSSGSGMYLFNLPSGLSMDSGLVIINSGVALGANFTDSGSLGKMTLGDGTNVTGIGMVSAYTLTQLKANFIYVSTTPTSDNQNWGSAGRNLGATTHSLSLEAKLPISGWLA